MEYKEIIGIWPPTAIHIFTYILDEQLQLDPSQGATTRLVLRSTAQHHIEKDHSVPPVDCLHDGWVGALLQRRRGCTGACHVGKVERRYTAVTRRLPIATSFGVGAVVWFVLLLTFCCVGPSSVAVWRFAGNGLNLPGHLDADITRTAATNSCFEPH